MPAFYYKAIDATNHKLSGTIDAPNARWADRDLRENGLRPYFLHDVREIKEFIRRKRLRRRLILVGGGVSIALALVVSGAVVGYAGREQAPDIAEYQRVGLIADGSEPIVAKADPEREFAMEILKIWNNFIPGVVVRVEVRPVLMTIYVDRKIRRYDEGEIEMLATQTVRALQRRFGTSGSTVLLVEDDLTMLEIRYTPFTKSTRVKFYR